MRQLLLYILVFYLMFSCRPCEKTFKNRSGLSNHQKNCSARAAAFEEVAQQARAHTAAANAAKLQRREVQVLDMERQNLRDTLNEVRFLHDASRLAEFGLCLVSRQTHPKRRTVLEHDIYAY